MFIKKVTWRHRNDFHFISECENCGDLDRWGDGYADYKYQEQVFPSRKCFTCGLPGTWANGPVSELLWFVS